MELKEIADYGIGVAAIVLLTYTFAIWRSILKMYNNTKSNGNISQIESTLYKNLNEEIKIINDLKICINELKFLIHEQNEIIKELSNRLK